MALWAFAAAPTTAAGSPAAVTNALGFTVTPAASGEQLVRASLPFPPGLIGTNAQPEVVVVPAPTTGAVSTAALRVLSLHAAPPPAAPSVRRGLVSFLHTFKDLTPVRFELRPASFAGPRPCIEGPSGASGFSVDGTLRPEGVALRWADGTQIDLALIAPVRSSRAGAAQPRLEEVESSPLFRWQRLHVPDPDWPRVIEIRLDRQGTVTLSAHLQRASTNGAFAPDLGWEVRPHGSPSLGLVALTSSGSRPGTTHSFASGTEAVVQIGGTLELRAPAGAANRRGDLVILTNAAGHDICRYRRCLASESVPMQWMAWRRADLTLTRPGVAVPTLTLSSPHHVEVDSRIWAALYGMPAAPRGLPQDLDSLLRYHRQAIARSSARGDDLGNVTSFHDGQEHGSVFGMNRLNHGAAIFEDAWRSADRQLRETAVLWCDNFHDLSIWWGEPERGGTRYNNIIAQNRTPPTRDFMWRSDSSVNFCTKGYDCFWLAWEETGDPRMREALEAQLEYAARHLHANVECRNIGDVRDFIRLYEFTGERRHLDEALRLFRELRAKLSTGNLFDQGGKPIDPDPPFINDDQAGLKLGYAKPYILGYALNGLPDLLRYAPEEPELRATILAVADFLAGSVDPIGGWRYPHPHSTDTLVSQGIEHAWQLTQAARVLGPEPAWLDAIEKVLRGRIHAWRRTGRILAGLGGWEAAAGRVKNAAEVGALYRHPSDRDPTRDYTEGNLGFGSAPPEGLVYFSDVLAYYLEHRPVDRLLADPPADSPLGRVLARTPRRESTLPALPSRSP